MLPGEGAVPLAAARRNFTAEHESLRSTSTTSVKARYYTVSPQRLPRKKAPSYPSRRSCPPAGSSGPSVSCRNPGEGVKDE